MQSDWTEAFSWAMMACGTVACATLACGVTAGYGRYSRSGWGAMVPARTAWIAQEIWSLLIPLALLVTSDRGTRSKCLSRAKTLLLAMLCLHYTYRSLIYPFRIRSGKPTPAAICLMAAAFCTCNGLLQGWWLLREEPAADGGLHSFRFWVGCVCWAAGWGINFHSDATLRALRNRGQRGYFIPQGGLFCYVSGANFLGEILEWSGWALAAWRLPAVAFAYFTACNLAPRAWQHHRDYVQRFGSSYPPHRRALIPFLW